MKLALLEGSDPVGLGLVQEQHDQALAGARVMGANTFFWCEVTSKYGLLPARSMTPCRPQPHPKVAIDRQGVRTS